jgi:small-conductance mechanosensitive channel
VATLPPEEERRRARVRTLPPILRTVLLAVMAVLMALSALGVQIGPLIAGAGVVGVAVGFGSQILVKDVISGVFYLLDDAFRVGEHIESGSIRGTVEGFPLRSVKLRHHRGYLHTVPFDTDLAQVKKVVKQVSKEIMADPDLAKGILEPPEVAAGRGGDERLRHAGPGEIQGQARRAVRRPPRRLRQDQEGLRRQRDQARGIHREPRRRRGPSGPRGGKQAMELARKPAAAE